MIKLCAEIIDDADIDSLIEWLKTKPILTKNKLTVEFEEKFSAKLGVKHSVFCNSGSSANLLAFSALAQSGKMKNNKVVAPQVSWSTTVFPIIQFGLQPILCDCNMQNLGLDLGHLENIFQTENPAALILVHVLGFDCNIQEVKALCDKYSVLLIEDTCESLGSEVHGKKLGTFGDMSSFSFYFGHHISTIEGGMICTDDDDLAEILRMIRSHGWDRDISEDSKKKYRNQYNVDEFNALYKFYFAGFNLRSTDLQAFIGLRQVDKIDNIASKRHENFLIYDELIKDTIWKPQPSSCQNLVSNMGYPIIVRDREKLAESLNDNNIECRPLIAGSIGMQPVWQKLFGKVGHKNSCLVDSNGMYVPNHHDMDIKDIEKVCQVINNLY
jgi:CDP-6-deoxy-D-xylo-4-hexulose-3-dehydrase